MFWSRWLSWLRWLSKPPPKGRIPKTLFAANPSNACPAYLNLKAAINGHCRSGRDHCEDLWQDFADIVGDPHFCTEFPLHLHERWFEMYLAVALKRAGLDVQCPKAGPDVLLTINERRIWIEATCASAGDPELPDSVPEPHVTKPGEPVVVNSVPTDEISLRIRNSLDKKEKKFQSWIADGTISPDDVTVVAINVHKIPHAWPDMDDYMRRTLYGLGDLQLNVDRDTLAVVDQGHEHRPTIAKKSGSPINLQPFVDGSLAHIAAVLGSSEDTVNRPPRLGDGFVLYPNITAKTQWPVGTIKLGGEWLCAEETENQLTKVSYTV